MFEDIHKIKTIVYILYIQMIELCYWISNNIQQKSSELSLKRFVSIVQLFYIDNPEYIENPFLSNF